MPILRRLLLVLMLLVTAFCAFRIYALEQQRKALKEDLVELSKIKYGLFSIDEWKRILADILSKKIDELDFSAEEKTEVREKVQAFLENTVAELEERFYEEKSNSFLGIIQGGVASFTGIFDKIKKDIPLFTGQILDFLNDPANRDKVKAYIQDKLSDYADRTFGSIDYTEHNQILEKYSFGDRGQTIAGLRSALEENHVQMRPFLIAIYAMLFFSMVLFLVSTDLSKIEFLIATLFCLVFLVCGLMFPMIEIDARIQEMSFTLLGEPVTFNDQVLYYRSKSILEVVSVLLQQGKWDVGLVGALVLLFSVIFPVSKLICSLLYVYRTAIAHNPILRFMVFKTGKWSMADVMVVAIFMSYIGFTGILTEQLNQLEGLTKSLDILTTNQSSLQTGFFLFTGFAVLNLLLSQKLSLSKRLE